MSGQLSTSRPILLKGEAGHLNPLRLTGAVRGELAPDSRIHGAKSIASPMARSRNAGRRASR
jgi:hypothetical protein